jgi:hypothetical protein
MAYILGKLPEIPDNVVAAQCDDSQVRWRVSLEEALVPSVATPLVESVDERISVIDTNEALRRIDDMYVKAKITSTPICNKSQACNAIVLIDGIAIPNINRAGMEELRRRHPSLNDKQIREEFVAREYSHKDGVTAEDVCADIGWKMALCKTCAEGLLNLSREVCQWGHHLVVQKIQTNTAALREQLAMACALPEHDGKKWDMIFKAIDTYSAGFGYVARLLNTALHDHFDTTRLSSTIELRMICKGDDETWKCDKIVRYKQETINDAEEATRKFESGPGCCERAGRGNASTMCDAMHNVVLATKHIPGICQKAVKGIEASKAAIGRLKEEYIQPSNGDNFGRRMVNGVKNWWTSVKINSEVKKSKKYLEEIRKDLKKPTARN